MGNTKKFVANMNSHENSSDDDAEAKIEFCYGGTHGKYMPMHNVYSVSYTHLTLPTNREV